MSPLGFGKLGRVVGTREMREVISEAVLRDAISDRMAVELTIRSGVFWARPVRCERKCDGSNWRLAFEPRKVPPGYTETWERIRHEFEDRHDMADP
jgi:hypothetical protein